MRIKTTIAKLSCPAKPPKWEKVETYNKLEVPEHLKKEVLDIWKYMQHGRFRDYETKYKAIELYNTITNSNYDRDTNCLSCLNAVKELFRRIINRENLKNKK